MSPNEEPVFRYEPTESGYIKIVQGRASVRDIVFAIARKAYEIAVLESPLPGESSTPPSDEFLSQFFHQGLVFPEEGKTILRRERFDDDRVFEMDYVQGLCVKASMMMKNGELLFCGVPYSANHRVTAEFMLDRARNGLELKLELGELN